MIYIFSRFICFCLCKVFFRFKIFERHRIPKKGPLIIASNHASFLDPVIIGVASPRTLNFMARHDLFHNRFFRWFLRGLNTFPVRREGSALSAFKEALRILRERKALVVFPEGTRTSDGSIRKAHSGVGLLAVKTSSTVVPVYVDGTRGALPRGAFFIRFKPVRVYCGKPLNPRDNLRREGEDTYQRFADSVMESISALRIKAIKKG